MRKKNHFSWTLALSLWLYFFYFKENISYTVLFAFFTAMISWIPDVDIRIVKNLNELNKNTFYLLYPITFVLKLIFKHRTVTHSIWFCMIFYLLSEHYFHNQILVIVFRIIYIAILMHIFEDTFTVSGVNIFYPLKLKIRLFRFSTDSSVHFAILELFAYCVGCSFFFYAV